MRATTQHMLAPSSLKGDILPPLTAKNLVTQELTKFPFTEKRIAALPAPHPEGKQKLYWDDGTSGFGVLVSGTTTTKTYIAQRKNPSGQTVRIKIDRTDRLPLHKARQEAETRLEEIRKGIDHRAAKKANATANKYAELTLQGALDAFLQAKAKLRATTKVVYRTFIEKNLKDWLDLPLRDITSSMVLEEHQAIQRRVKTRRKMNHGRASANGTMRSLRVVWNYTHKCEALERTQAAQTGKRGATPPSPPELVTNPVDGLTVLEKWSELKPRTRMVENEDLPRFYAAVDALESRTASDYIKLLLFTGMRRSEAGRMEWKEVKFASRAIEISAEKTKTGKPLALPMTDYVFDLLSARRDLGREKSGFVFAANGKSGYLHEPKHLFLILYRATGIQISAHDLRRTFATVAESADISPWSLKAMLNHTLGKGVTDGYIQMRLERLRPPAQKVTDRIKELCGISADAKQESA